ncbi:hypothetical protein K492DRAFT_177058 [Lichtheimia hyalospora FSU 10163]|nr:hypothetical protein K492DRAFT_177058 [Lichtheimia hyalospora FSU 10163]
MSTLRDPWYKERHMATRSTRTLEELDLRILFGDVYRQTATMLSRHYMHLKKIRLDIDGGDWGVHVKQHDMSTLGDHPLPALEELEYHSNRQAPIEASFVIPLLKKCPNLKRILLDTRMADPIYRALVGLDLPHLQHLSILETDTKMDGLEEFLFSIAHTNSPLKSFEFKGNVFNSRIIYQALAQISSLRHIELNDFAWRKRDKICVTRCLRQLRGDSSTISNLESIVFCNVEGFMTVEAFGSLRKIPSLKQVTLHRCGSISEPGLRLLVDRKPPLEFLEIHLSSSTMDGKSLEPTLTYARSKIHRVKATGP